MTSMLRRSASSVELDPAAIAGVPGMETRMLQSLQLRAGDDQDGTFEGYACVWDVTDSYGTTFRQGCFGAGGLDTDPYALLEMHNPVNVSGLFTAVEDGKGLLIKGGWDDTALGRDGRARAKSGSANGLSVGFVPIMVDPDDENVFTQCRLVEVSQITRRMASVPGAELTAARKRLRESHPDAIRRRDDATTLAIARLRLSAPIR